MKKLLVAILIGSMFVFVTCTVASKSDKKTQMEDNIKGNLPQ